LELVEFSRAKPSKCPYKYVITEITIAKGIAGSGCHVVDLILRKPQQAMLSFLPLWKLPVGDLIDPAIVVAMREHSTDRCHHAIECG
jgi:hypothetical protein